ncbi:hypothetical protein CI610_03383 [invertebrate metagenome]|uniref:Uncharacterized protein n=1 Tax=invertebrate metagenome TaxID=1711999 RepID=A0A2H9T381_9ZZZZ
MSFFTVGIAQTALTKEQIFLEWLHFVLLHSKVATHHRLTVGECSVDGVLMQAGQVSRTSEQVVIDCKIWSWKKLYKYSLFLIFLVNLSADKIYAGKERKYKHTGSSTYLTTRGGRADQQPVKTEKPHNSICPAFFLITIILKKIKVMLGS